MASLTVWKYSTPEGAGQALTKLGELSKQQLISVQDAAIVSWPVGSKKPKTHQMASTTGAGALGGAFWGMLFGLLFFVPFLGLAIGAAMGAMAGPFSDYGIDDNFIKSVRSEVTEGTSALFLLSSDAVLDKFNAAFEGMEKGVLLKSNLSAEQEAKLLEDFGA